MRRPLAALALAATLGGCSSHAAFVPSSGVATPSDAVRDAGEATAAYEPLGGRPWASLSSLGGTLYGTTRQGGTHSLGTLFSVTASGASAVVRAFDSASGPRAGVTPLDGTLYGTAIDGGTYGGGAIYGVDPTNGSVSEFYSFRGAPDAQNPGSGALLAVGHVLYGSTYRGGQYGYGTIYTYDTLSKTERVIYSFQNGRDGAYPADGLVLLDGVIYGTAAQGGANNDGTLFAIDPISCGYHVLYAFRSESFIGNPIGTLTAYQHRLYGLLNGTGAIFRYDPATHRDTTLYRFASAPDGSSPDGGLTPAYGRLYGTTLGGGQNGLGTVYSIDPATGQERVIYSFDGPHGRFPYSGLTLFNNLLYGTTPTGGTNDNGTVYAVDATGNQRVLVNF